MRKQLFKCTFLFIFSLFSFVVRAQDYKYEIGGMTGGSFYMGDANKTSLYKNTGPSIGAIFRYNHDFRWSLKSNLILGHVSGSTERTGDALPFNSKVSFSRNFYEFGGQVEFNFFNYSDKYAYLDTKRWTPYVLLGVGMTLGSGEEKYFSMNIPVGIGLKYKLKERINIGFEFSFRKLFDDGFDVTSKTGFSLSNPLGTNNSDIKNKDWYSLTLISITWDFGARCNPCLNE